MQVQSASGCDCCCFREVQSTPGVIAAVSDRYNQRLAVIAAVSDSTISVWL